MKDQPLISTLPEYRVRRITYDIYDGSPPPKDGEYMVTVITGRKPGTVYQVCSVRKVNSQKYPNRYAIEVIVRPKMLEHACVSFRMSVCLDFGVKGIIPAHAIFWHSRTKK